MNCDSETTEKSESCQGGNRAHGDIAIGQHSVNMFWSKAGKPDPGRVASSFPKARFFSMSENI